MYLIVGSNGQLGHELAARLPSKDAIFTDVDELDITKKSQIEKFVNKYNPSAIVNCAAYTNVDKAEDNHFLAEKINCYGPRFLAETGIDLIHISTDYVFDGKGGRPYLPSDTPNPISEYGRTKRMGERCALENGKNVVIIRTAWLYSPYGNNFVKTMRKLGTTRDSINVVADQVGTPTYAGDLADAIVTILPQMQERYRGIYHFTNAGVCSWYDFARKTMELSGLNCRVNPINSSEYPTRAKRPFYSVLDKEKIVKVFGIELRHWEDALRECIVRMNGMTK